MKHITHTIQNTLTNPIFLAIWALVFLFSPVFAREAFAAIPTLSLAQQGTTGVYVTVNGDQNQPVNMYYYSPGTTVINSIGSIGSTNSGGVFTTVLSNGAYNIPSGSSVFVIVNGQQSSTVLWPATAGGPVYLSQTNLSISNGQSASVSISGGSGSNYYVSSNSNSNAVSATVSGSILTVTALNTGNAVIQVCSLNGYSSCASVYVTVNTSWYGNNQIYISPSSVSVVPGQSQVVYINNNTFSNTNQGYYISSNGGSQYFTASISGNTMTIYGNNPGSGTVTVCAQFAVSSCASVYVTVGNGYTNWNSNWYNTYNTYPYSYYGNNTGGFTLTNSGTYYPNTYSYSYSNPTYTYPSTTYTPASTYGNSVSGVFLSQVPSTGISFGLKMTLFTLGLLLWSAFVAFMIARKHKSGNIELSTATQSIASNMTRSISDKIQAFKLNNLKHKGF